MAEIVLDKVTKRYADGTLAVEEVNLDIADGEFVILVGPSGCGKTTTLNMIAGLEDISSGELRIDGRRVNEASPKDRDIAMVFQSYALYPHMTVRQNMGFALKLAKVSKSEIDHKVNEAAEILELTPYLDKKPANLSGGQRQRVAMGRAIVRSPKAFLMDEPLSNLDAKLRVQMRTSVSRLQKRLATTTVYVTHDQTEAMTLGDRVVVMKLGVVQQVGAPQLLYAQPANLFVAGFIGSPSMNFIPVTVADGTLTSPIGAVPLTARVKALLDRHSDVPRDLIMGVRPEAFEDAALVPGDSGAGLEFSAQVDVVESMGAEIFAYLPLSATVESEHLAEAAEAAGEEDPTVTNQLVTRLSPESAVKEGKTSRFRLDADRVSLFDPDSGLNLTLEAGSAG